MTFDIAARAKELALMMTRWPSITGSVEEAALPAKLLAELQFDKMWVSAIAKDAAGRSNVFALKRCSSRRTIVLTGPL